MPTLDELIRPRTRDEIRQALLDELARQGFPLTDFVPGSVARHVAVETPALGLEDLWQTIVAIARGGYLSTASGPWLDLLAEEFFAVQRKPATYAQGRVRLTASPGFGPYAIAPGDLWVGTADGLLFNNITGGTLTPGGQLDLEVRAESPGARYNVPAGAIQILHTPLPGVSVTNPAEWLIVAGADEETDDDLRKRCRARWAELGGGATRHAYEYWALTAHPSVTKVRVLDDHPRGQGTVDVVIWGEGGLGADVVSQVNDYIQARRPLTANVLVYSATPRTVNVQAAIAVAAGHMAAAQAAVADELNALQRETPIGGILYRSRVIEALFARPYVVNVTVNSPGGDVVLGPTEAVVLAPVLTWQEV
ncbi:baseplate J/gp47 family protein [Thermus tengchongensis]|uniref:Baseplate J/gp47 family protein n=1 Tax=Thermus tengchongensis TaxID=1214928 RepID=A0A4Y9F902_9DEIN|nr:baseplate J/gp47 family protein [Thermus tengchongensis]TFU25647.1 baseplate J/gp47 family protein [Thermus tengchongensis]